VAALVPADLRRDPTRLRHPEVAELLHGMVWSRLGDGAAAWAWFDRVGEVSLLSWVLAEKGRFLRELGLHEHSEELDLEALAVAGDMSDIIRARISLVADAVGRGEFEVAALRLQAVDALLERVEVTPEIARQRLRRAWVAVEVALVKGEEPPTDGLPHLDGGQIWFPPEQAHGTTFEAAKGLLFAAIAHGDLRLLELASADAPAMLSWAVHLARMDSGMPEAWDEAREAWAKIIAPPGFADEVARTPVAKRLR
jgi:hypothetical protein